MDETRADSEQARKAFYALRDARKAMQEMIAESIRTNDTRPVYSKLKTWLPVVVEGENDMGNLLSARDPLDYVGQVRQIALKMRPLGQRQIDTIAEHIERAIGELF